MVAKNVLSQVNDTQALQKHDIHSDNHCRTQTANKD
jgi:hypothetical protein